MNHTIFSGSFFCVKFIWIKKQFYLLVILLFSFSTYGQYAGVVSSSTGSSFRFNLYGSYAFEDSFDSYYDLGNYYQGKIMGGLQYGASIEYSSNKGSSVEILYLRQDTNAPTQYYNGGLYNKFENFDLAMNYILIGGNQRVGRPNANVEGFGGLLAGMAIIEVKSPTTDFSSSATKFAWGFKGGVILWPMKTVGIKLQAQLLSVAQSIGGGVYFTPGGITTGVSSYSSIYQFSLGGGLVFKFDN
jgi:hypothetical protein